MPNRETGRVNIPSRSGSFRELMETAVNMQAYRMAPPYVATGGGTFDTAQPLAESTEAVPYEELVKSLTKKRHLRSGERESLHKPGNDWFTTGSGEVCKSATTIVVNDILTKYGIDPKVVKVRKYTRRVKTERLPGF